MVLTNSPALPGIGRLRLIISLEKSTISHRIRPFLSPMPSAVAVIGKLPILKRTFPTGFRRLKNVIHAVIIRGVRSFILPSFFQTRTANIKVMAAITASSLSMEPPEPLGLFYEHLGKDAQNQSSDSARNKQYRRNIPGGTSEEDKVCHNQLCYVICGRPCQT